MKRKEREINQEIKEENDKATAVDADKPLQISNYNQIPFLVIF